MSCPSPLGSVEDVAARVALRAHYRGGYERRSREPLVALTQRLRLDAFLAEQAARTGVEVRDGVRVVEVGESESGFRLRAAGDPVEARMLVGADGANGLTARALGLAEEVVRGVALEGNVRYGIAHRYDFAGRIVLEFGVVSGGYGWVFPKGDHVNVGVGGWGGEGPRLRDHLRRLCAAHGLPFQRVERLRGHRLPCGCLRRASPVVGGSSSATRPGSSTPSRATGCTRRSSARVSPPPRLATCWRAAPRLPMRTRCVSRASSAASPRSPGASRQPSIGIRGSRSRSCACPSSGRWSSRSSAVSYAIPASRARARATPRARALRARGRRGAEGGRVTERAADVAGPAVEAAALARRRSAKPPRRLGRPISGTPRRSSPSPWSPPALPSTGSAASASLAAFTTVVLVAVPVTDLERRIIPNRVVLPATAIVLVGHTILDPTPEWLLGALGASAFLFVAALISPQGMGMGDVKLGAPDRRDARPRGRRPPWRSAPCWPSSPASPILIRHGRAGRKMGFPFGPFLALGALVVLLRRAVE